MFLFQSFPYIENPNAATQCLAQVVKVLRPRVRERVLATLVFSDVACGYPLVSDGKTTGSDWLAYILGHLIRGSSWIIDNPAAVGS